MQKSCSPRLRRGLLTYIVTRQPAGFPLVVPAVPIDYVRADMKSNEPPIRGEGSPIVAFASLGAAVGVAYDASTTPIEHFMRISHLQPKSDVGSALRELSREARETWNDDVEPHLYEVSRIAQQAWENFPLDGL